MAEKPDKTAGKCMQYPTLCKEGGSMRDTPETDALYWRLQGQLGTGTFEMCMEPMRKLERQRNELCDALQEALKRMEHLEGWKNGTKVTLPTCECAIEYAKEVIAKAKGETL